jgi:hypothetical protein
VGQGARQAAAEEAATKDAGSTLDDPPAPTEVAQGDEREQTVDLPIYRWFEND